MPFCCLYTSHLGDPKSRFSALNCIYFPSCVCEDWFVLWGWYRSRQDTWLSFKAALWDSRGMPTDTQSHVQHHRSSQNHPEELLELSWTVEPTLYLWCVSSKRGGNKEDLETFISINSSCGFFSPFLYTSVGIAGEARNVFF